MRTFIGCDICKNHVVCWSLFERPKNLKSYWREQSKLRSRKPREDNFTFYFTQAGIDSFLSLRPTAIALEPTGYHYSALLANICEQEGIEVYWVGHSEVSHYRRGHKLPDKNDMADALALAAYLHENYGRDEFFLQFSPGPPKKLRELYLQMQSINRMQSPVINRLRQQLAVEFPEVALKDSRQNSSGLAPLWAWLARRDITQCARSRYDNLWRKSVSTKYGGEISTFTRDLANQLCRFHLIEARLEIEIEKVLSSPEFRKYRDVLARFGMKRRTQALVISQVYPLSRFDALPQFKKRLGCAGEEESSGDRTGFRASAGSKLARRTLYLWVLTTIAPRKSRPKTIQCQKLGEYYDAQKDKIYGRKDEMRSQIIHRQLRNLKNQIRQELGEQLTPLVRQKSSSTIESHLDLIAQLLSTSLESRLTETLSHNLRPAEVKRGFGNLVIMRVAGYACKLLFKELKASVSE